MVKSLTRIVLRPFGCKMEVNDEKIAERVFLFEKRQDFIFDIILDGIRIEPDFD